MADLAWLSSQGLQLFQIQHDLLKAPHYVIGYCCLLMLASICFSLSHWIFSFKYWACAQRLTLLLNGKKPTEMDKRMSIINFVICSLNVIFPAMYAWAYGRQIADSTNTLKPFYTISTALNLLLQLLSLLFLSVALLQIKYSVRQRSILTINPKAMCLHYACFVFFFLATIAYFVADILDPPPVDISIHLYTEIIKIISSVIL